MQLGEGVEWAVHCCLVLAALPEGATLPAAKLAEFHGVPGAYLSKQLGALAAAGIVESTVGRYGGYRLARPADEVTVWDVVSAVEADDTLFRCTEIRRRGPAAAGARAYPSPCSVAKVMWQAEEAWRDELRRHSLAELMLAVARTAPPQSLAKGATWLQSSVRLPSGTP